MYFRRFLLQLWVQFSHFGRCEEVLNIVQDIQILKAAFEFHTLYRLLRGQSPITKNEINRK